MKPDRILPAAPRRLMGKFIRMNLVNNRTRELWSGFMPVRHRIKDPLSENYFSVQVFDGPISFDPEHMFVKWAAMEASPSSILPDDMHELHIPQGEYAVFIHEGPASNFPQTLRNILEWLEESAYQLDDRPYFEIIPPDYPGIDSPDAREEIWMPVVLS